MCRRFVLTLVSCVLTFLCVCALWLQNVFPLSHLKGERTYYLYSASSQAIVKNTLSCKEVPFLKGQSVALQSSVDVQTIAGRYGATLVKRERVGQTECYYYYVKGRVGVLLDGQIVNLHIVVTEDKTIVGVPLIFGSF